MIGIGRGEWMRQSTVSDGFDWAEATFVSHRFSPHRHHAYAIGITTHGVQCFGYRAADWHALPGDAFVLYPDERHDGRAGTAEGYGYRIVYVSPDRIADAAGGRPFWAEPVSRAPQVARAIRSIFPDLGDPAEPLRETDALCVLAAALTGAAAGDGPPAAPDMPMLHLRDHLAATASRRVSMAALEAEHGLDRYTIARRFRRSFGVSPSRYVTLRRLEAAMRLIAAGHSLADAALAAGFADQPHMTRQFRAAYGTTPGRWRRLVRAA